MVDTLLKPFIIMNVPFQMERNRKSYVEATDRLVCFLDEVTSALQSTSHTAHRRLLESTRYAVNSRSIN